MEKVHRLALAGMATVWDHMGVPVRTANRDFWEANMSFWLGIFYNGLHMVVALTGQVIEMAQVNLAGNAHAGRNLERRKQGNLDWGVPPRSGMLHMDIQPGGIFPALQFHRHAGIVGNGQPHVHGFPR